MLVDTSGTDATMPSNFRRYLLVLRPHFQNTVDFKYLLTVDIHKVNTSAAFNNVSVGGLLLSNVSGANALIYF
jgi:hypothetical protein